MKKGNPAAWADPNRWLALVSLFYPVYYMAISWAITATRWYRTGWL